MRIGGSSLTHKEEGDEAYLVSKRVMGRCGTRDSVQRKDLFWNHKRDVGVLVSDV